MNKKMPRWVLQMYKEFLYGGAQIIGNTIQYQYADIDNGRSYKLCQCATLMPLDTFLIKYAINR